MQRKEWEGKEINWEREPERAWWVASMEYERRKPCAKTLEKKVEKEERYESCTESVHKAGWRQIMYEPKFTVRQKLKYMGQINPIRLIIDGLGRVRELIMVFLFLKCI